MNVKLNFILPDNATVEITPEEVILTVTLNVPKILRDKADFKGYSDKRSVLIEKRRLNHYALIPNNMYSHYRDAVNTLKLRARRLKIKQIKSEIKEIKHEQLTLFI